MEVLRAPRGIQGAWRRVLRAHGSGLVQPSWCAREVTPAVGQAEAWRGQEAVLVRQAWR